MSVLSTGTTISQSDSFDGSVFMFGDQWLSAMNYSSTRILKKKNGGKIFNCLQVMGNKKRF